jgi:hypothetical protein
MKKPSYTRFHRAPKNRKAVFGESGIFVKGEILNNNSGWNLKRIITRGRGGGTCPPKAGPPLAETLYN